MNDDTITVFSESELTYKPPNNEEWLIKYNLKRLIPIFKKDEISIYELIRLFDREDQFENYCKEINLHYVDILRLRKGINEERKKIKFKSIISTT